MKTRLSKIAFAATLLALQWPASATDIDLYVTAPPAAGADLPNVLFVIDNTANWGGKDTDQPFANERAALVNTLNSIPSNKFNIGIMFASESGSGTNSNGKGGYVRAAIRTMNDTNKQLYANLASSFSAGNDKSSGGASGVEMAEAYRYFAGLAPYTGNSVTKADYTGNTNGGTSQSNAVYGLSGNALSSFSATKYNSPIQSGSCAKNYIIYISNGPNQENSSLDGIANSLLTQAGGDTTMIPLTPSGSQNNPSDEWARFMKQSALGVSTYTIDVNPVTNGQGPAWTALLKSMSAVSGGTYTSVSSSSGSAPIYNAINNALSQIQSVNSVFAAVSLPASANIQGAYLNQLFVGMFRPDANAKPLWPGNLKQYQLDTNNNLADADGNPAINSQTGFIAECARSFWTPTTQNPDNYWANNPMGACLPPSGSPSNLYKISNTPDGNMVEKGAEGYMLRKDSPTSRTMKTCSPVFANCTAFTSFDTTNSAITQTLLGAASSTERDNLINWARGLNIDGELGMATNIMRPSAHADVIHSNPLALSYGTDIVVYYGSNDGVFHAVNGNQSASIGTVAPGDELWSFMPPEFWPNIKRVHDNSPLISIAQVVGTTPSGTTSPKPWGIDGPVTVYKDASQTLIYATMRRGGRAVYAFNATSATSPSLKWKAGCDSNGNCTSGFSGIGQTWSSAQPVKVAGYNSGSIPVIVMGGGYDNCEDTDPQSCYTNGAFNGKGNGIFVLDATSGNLLTTLPTDRGVVGDIRFAPGTNGMAKYGYAADLGGNVYRITIDTLVPSAWTIKKIASLGCDTAGIAQTCTANRKFMFAPSVVPESDGSYSIYIGSGDREKPLNANYYPTNVTITNYFFKIKDNPADVTWLTSESTNCNGISVICLKSLLNAGSTGTNCAGTGTTSSGKGWAVQMRATEQVVTPAATRYGYTTFSTHIPSTTVPGSCSPNLGTTHVYTLNINDATAKSGTTCNATVAGGGLPPPPEKIDVCKVDGSCSSICIGCSTSSSIQVQDDSPTSSSTQQTGKKRVYWYVEKTN